MYIEYHTRRDASTNDIGKTMQKTFSTLNIGHFIICESVSQIKIYDIELPGQEAAGIIHETNNVQLLSDY